MAAVRRILLVVILTRPDHDLPSLIGSASPDYLRVCAGCEHQPLKPHPPTDGRHHATHNGVSEWLWKFTWAPLWRRRGVAGTANTLTHQAVLVAISLPQNLGHLESIDFLPSSSDLRQARSHNKQIDLKCNRRLGGEIECSSNRKFDAFEKLVMHGTAVA